MIRFFSIVLVSFVTTCLANDGSCKKDDDKVPFFGGAQFDYIAPAEFNEHDLHGEHLKYRVGRENLAVVCYYNPDRKEALYAGLSYTQTYLNWNQNPLFHQRYFNNLSFNFGGITHRVKDWYWRGNVNFNFDTDHFSPGMFLTYDLLLWGRYSYCKDLGLHIGFYAITGMKIDRVYPVLGIDYRYSEKLKLNLVFPTEINATWEMSKAWSTGGAIRFFQSRQRVGKHEPLPYALWYYLTWGGEWFVNYNLTDFIHLNLHAGYTFGGKLKLTNRHYDNGHHLKTKGAPYAGATIVLAY